MKVPFLDTTQFPGIGRDAFDYIVIITIHRTDGHPYFISRCCRSNGYLPYKSQATACIVLNVVCGNRDTCHVDVAIRILELHFPDGLAVFEGSIGSSDHFRIRVQLRNLHLGKREVAMIGDILQRAILAPIISIVIWI